MSMGLTTKIRVMSISPGFIPQGRRLPRPRVHQHPIQPQNDCVKNDSGPTVFLEIGNDPQGGKQMGIDRETKDRRSIRLKDYDYSQAGAYFVTICVQNRECILGSVVTETVQLTEPGLLVLEVWDRLPNSFPNIQLDALMVMPNHVHGIILIADPHQGAASGAPTRHCPSLGKIIRVFKSVSAVQINRLLGRTGQSVWQRNYYEHVIRNHDDLNHIRLYIQENPRTWANDPENPKAIK